MEKRELTILLLTLVKLSRAEDKDEDIDKHEDVNAPSCFDEHPNCVDFVLGGACFGRSYGDTSTYTSAQMKEAAKYLAMCRESCVKHIRDRKNLTSQERKVVALAGGLGNAVYDDFGNRFEICNLSHGFTLQARYRLLQDLVNSRLSYLAEWHTTVPRYTKEGFKKVKAPKKLFGEIKDFYTLAKKRDLWKPEKCEPGIMNCEVISDNGEECMSKNITTYFMARVPANVGASVEKVLTGPAQEWSGVKRLNLTAVYGIRRYTRDSWLGVHVDRNTTHIISAIINVGQKVDEPWPLQMLDYDGKRHQLVLKPGDMVWYESARLPHGRAKPLKGDYFDNIFIHFNSVNEKEYQRIQKEKREKTVGQFGKINLT